MTTQLYITDDMKNKDKFELPDITLSNTSENTFNNLIFNILSYLVEINKSREEKKKIKNFKSIFVEYNYRTEESEKPKKHSFYIRKNFIIKGYSIESYFENKVDFVQNIGKDIFISNIRIQLLHTRIGSISAGIINVHPSSDVRDTQSIELLNQLFNKTTTTTTYYYY